MSYIITDNKHYKNIASAIRSKLRVDTKYAPEEMASAIGNIHSSDDGTNTPIVGIYYTDPDENRHPTTVKIVGFKNTTASIPTIFSYEFIKAYLKKVEFIDCVSKSLQTNCFKDCQNLENINFPDGISIISTNCFAGSGIIDLILPNSVTTLGQQSFSSCFNLKSVNIPNSVKTIAPQVFYNTPNIADTILENNFDADKLNLSYSTKYSRETIVSWLTALKDRTGETSYTLTIGNTNLKKLTNEDIAIANNKNWTIV